MQNERVRRFLSELEKSIKSNQFLSMMLSSPRSKENGLKSISAKLIDLRGSRFLSLVSKFKTMETTENLSVEEAVNQVARLLDTTFFQAELVTASVRWHLILNTGKNGKLKRTNLVENQAVSRTHDKEKKRLISGAPFLVEIGICNADGSVKPSMSDKFKQINRYVEIVDGILKNAEVGETFTVADMGCGKGYLTFALYHHLTANLGVKPNIVGVEVREDLVDKCNQISGKLGYENLRFKVGAIIDAELENCEVLIALHACDTATDDAIFRGLNYRSKVILTAPCCHKQVRKSLQAQGELASITKHGILKERQAEILTDTIRSLVLEANGYNTKVFEFIASEHTPKNIMIAAVKNDSHDESAHNQIDKLKSTFGLESHYLLTLLSENC